MSWYPVCPFDRLPRERAVCVLIRGVQVALVRTADDHVYAVDNLDPISGALVMSRGIVGSRGEVEVLISPMHKQAYDLATGRCLDADGVWLGTYDVRVVDGDVEVALREEERLLA
jgi:nitrite reductase (NADH) small subunit